MLDIRGVALSRVQVGMPWPTESQCASIGARGQPDAKRHNDLGVADPRLDRLRMLADLPNAQRVSLVVKLVRR